MKGKTFDRPRCEDTDIESSNVIVEFMVYYVPKVLKLNYGKVNALNLYVYGVSFYKSLIIEFIAKDLFRSNN